MIREYLSIPNINCMQPTMYNRGGAKETKLYLAFILYFLQLLHGI